MNKKELIALQNVLDCMDHYLCIDHVRDEYHEEDWEDLQRQVKLLNEILRKNPIESDRPFERLSLVFPNEVLEYEN